MKVIKTKLSDISPYYNNPRDNANAVAPVMESIKRFGFVKPIVCDKDGVIIVGHTRYIAAFQLGITEVPVIFTDMEDERAKQFRIADNKLAEKSSYDEDALIEELKKMSVPEDMQAFFMEDVHEMVNFSFDSFASQAPVDTDFEASFENDYNSSSDSNYEDESNYETDEGDEESEDYEEEFEDPADGLFQVRVVDGKKYMKVVCPYCGNIEEVEYED